ncbi:PilZ domain-containing protein [Radiobacillus kanasensis]|uniref:PilZ domain-containing protein n=1 Tax=Radiobacillus kanasensis TaxID=2844358 RepID=UPI001E5D5137|nr:PilZ domain-containing protein [Radiobacillus kanasensis]UFU00861.1 PilZ domain-containing protein [Radiobacillus kanasensis]
MYYKRNEPYRFSFEQPIPANIKTLTAEDTPSSTYQVLLLDVSLSGVRMECSTDIPIEQNKQYIIEFTLLDQHCVTTGEIVWMKDLSNKYHCGVQLDTDEQTQDQITSQLKQFVRNQRLSNRNESE